MRPLLFSLLILLSCSPKLADISSQSSKELIHIDKLMSDMAVKEGFNKALLLYADNQVIKPQEGKKSIIGKQSLEAAWNNNPGIRTLSWEPYKAETSRSGDLGYTVGHWTLVLKDSTLYGDYYTIWKRQSDGNWKFVLDAGNNTPKP